MRFLALCGLLITCLFLACTPSDAPDASSSSPRSAVATADTTVTDDLGRSVTLRRPVERVVSLAPNLTEIVFAAGAGKRLAAVTTSDDFPPAVDSLPHISPLPVDFEAVAAQDPDLILATDQVNAPRTVETFDALDLPVFFFSFDTIADVFDAIRQTGRLLGTPQAAADSAAALTASLDALRRQTEDVSPRPRVLVLIGDETLYAFGKSSYIHTLVDAAGGRSVSANLEAKAPTLSEEYVLQEKPDVLIGAWGADYNTDRILDLHPTWDVVPAVKNDRVYTLAPSLLLRPGPRLVRGARVIAQSLHPSLFDAPPSAATSASVPSTP